MFDSRRDKVVMLRDLIPSGKVLPSRRARFFSKNRLIIWLLRGG
jgi:hypothetical protein